MKTETLLNQWLSLLAASASPASALSLYMGVATFKPGMLRRGESPEKLVEATAAAEPKEGPHAPAERGWLGRLFDRLETWSWEREVRAREAYLAQSQDLYDLEVRMRHLDGDMLSRSCALR